MNKFLQVLLYRLLMGVVFGLIALPLTYAQEGNTCVPPTDPATGDPSGQCAQAGNPLNVMTGNKFQRETDMPALPGVLGLELVRIYNSAGSLPSKAGGAMGRGWQTSYDARLVDQGEGVTITLIQGDGTKVKFSRKGTSAHLSQTLPFVATEAKEGVLRKQEQVGRVSYELELPNQTKYTFDSKGALVQIKAAGGQTVKIARNEQGFIERVTDPQGRYMVFNYLTEAQKKDPQRYRGVQSIDTPIGRVVFNHGSQVGGDSAMYPLNQLANLVKVVVPGPQGQVLTKTYHYENERWPTLMTGMSVALGTSPPQRLVTWGYDSLGRANLSVKGHIGAQPGFEQVKLEFSAKSAFEVRQLANQEGSKSSTILTNSLGQSTRYDYQHIGGRLRLLQALGPGCATCGASNVRYGYDNLGRQTSQTQLDNNGQPVTGVAGTQTDYDPQGRVSRLSSVSYSKASPGTAILKLQARYEYTGDDTVASLVATPSVIKGKEHQIRYSRNQQGQITQVTETGFSPITDNKTNTAQELKRTTNYTYQSINGKSVLVAIKDPLGNTTQYQWDAQGNAVSQVNYPMGLTASMSYEASTGRMLQTTGIDGQTTQVSYTPQGDIASWTRAGRSITNEQDMLGRTVLWRSNDGQSIKANYDELDNKLQRQVRYTLSDGQSLVSSLSSESQTTSVGWQGSDQQGAQQTIINAKQTTYSPTTGLPVEITAPTGLKTTLGYDQANQLTSIQRGRQTISKSTESFDPLNHLGGQLTKLDVSGAKYTLGTKASENSLTLPTEASYTSTVDDFGRTVIMQSPEKGRSTASYDLNDRLIQLKDSLRTSTASFDALGRLVQRRHSINKDASGTAISTATVTVTTEPKDETFTYTYEGARLKSITGAAQTTTYSYTKEGQVAQEQVVLHTSKEQSQNQNQSNSFTTSHSYDTFGRLSQTQLPEGATLSHHYNAISRLQRVDYQPAAQAGWRGWWTQLARLAVPDYGTQALVTNIQTDSAHGLLGYQASNGQSVQASFDAAGRLKTWRDGPVATKLSFNQNDELAALDKSVPRLTTHTLNTRPAPTSSQQTLQYNIMGQLSDVKTVNEAGNKESNAATQALEIYSYDQNGNRLQSKQQAGQNSYNPSYTYRPASDQLQSIQFGTAKTSYSYNSHGEPVQISTAEGDKTQTRDLTYGARGELLAIADQGKATTSYQYNHALQRVSKTANISGKPETINYLWHGGMIDAEIQSGQVTKRYIFINLRPVAVIEYENDNANEDKTNTNSDPNRYSSDSYLGNKYHGYRPKSTAIYAIHTDHLGTPQAITDSQQAVVWRANYATFGKATVQARVVDVSNKTAKTSFGFISTANAATATPKPFEFNLRFAGQYEDTESGYHYNWHRYYDPSTGRYLTPDPIGLAGGLNGYGYAGQDPMGAVDPWGLSSVSANGTTTFTTDLADLPTFDIPTPAGWTDYNNSDLLGHTYNKNVTANNLTAAEINALRDYMVAHPTPSTLSKPATQNGTSNPATPNCGPFSGTLANLVAPDDVTSYTRTGKSGRTYVINVTSANHSLGSGIVIRGVSSNGSGGANFDNYGEGGGFNQSGANPLNDTLINNIWYWATETALENVTGRPYSVKGRDWTQSGNTANKKCGC